MLGACCPNSFSTKYTQPATARIAEQVNAFGENWTNDDRTPLGLTQAVFPWGMELNGYAALTCNDYIAQNQFIYNSRSKLSSWVPTTAGLRVAPTLQHRLRRDPQARSTTRSQLPSVHHGTFG